MTRRCVAERNGKPARLARSCLTVRSKEDVLDILLRKATLRDVLEVSLRVIRTIPDYVGVVQGFPRRFSPAADAERML